MPQAVTTGETLPSTPEITTEEAAATLRASLKLFERWGISDAQARILLGQPS